ncbi:type II toxin-antitoxin system VapB family antitoxin [Verrucomicrobiaceae bacterium 227]
MRTTINIDDTLLERAAAFTGIEERSKLVNAVFERFVASESAKRLKRLGGTMPDYSVPDRSFRTDPIQASPLNEGP